MKGSIANTMEFDLMSDRDPHLRRNSNVWSEIDEGRRYHEYDHHNASDTESYATFSNEIGTFIYYVKASNPVLHADCRTTCN